jgi:fatty acid desaturase
MGRRQILHRLHRKNPRPCLELAACGILFLALMAGTLLAWKHGWWPVTIACWLLQAHIGHTSLLAFHQASHYTLHPNRRLNELQGVLLGSVILTPLSAYRWVHNQHLLHLGTSRDTELWPFVDPRTPRWKRLLAAAGELLFGYFYTPVIFLRGVLVAKGMPRAKARRLVHEYALCVGLWAAVAIAVIDFGVMEEFVVGYLIPALLAGNLQSLRKFTEHMGLLGHDVASTTRTVIDTSLPGRLLSASMLHIDLHGPHHRHAKIPHHRLPEATPITCEEEMRDPASANVFASYFSAIWAMVRTLADPRIGVQWLANGELVVPRPRMGGPDTLQAQSSSPPARSLHASRQATESETTKTSTNNPIPGLSAQHTIATRLRAVALPAMNRDSH